MRNLSGILLILALLAVFLLPGWLRPGAPAAQAPAVEGQNGPLALGTPAAYFPYVMKVPTPTPTITPTPTATPTRVPYVISTGHLTGDIYFLEGWHWNPADNHFHFYAIIEPI